MRANNNRILFKDIYDNLSGRINTELHFIEKDEYAELEWAKIDLRMVYDEEEMVDKLIFNFDFQNWLKQKGYLMSGRCIACGFDKGIVSDNVIDIEIHFRMEHPEFYAAWCLQAKL